MLLQFAIAFQVCYIIHYPKSKLNTCTRFLLEPPVIYPCDPSPCGPNSQCREVNLQAVCSCIPGFIGAPPTCRPECVSSNECSLKKACVNQKCIDPCPGTCGINAKCQVAHHNPICSCMNKYTGDPFTKCIQLGILYTYKYLHMLDYSLRVLLIVDEPTFIDPCLPSPCGPNALCKIINNYSSCSCLPEYVGTPPYCKPECISNNECADKLACINQKCKNPCLGICGQNAECFVISHTPNCVCLQNYQGDPFTLCQPQRSKFLYKNI